MWRPADEIEACSEATALLEYRRATRGLPDLTPAEMAAWRCAKPDEYQVMVAEIRGVQTSSGANAETRAAGTSSFGPGLPNR